MTAYRYWRLNVTEGLSPANLRIGSMELRVNEAGANLAVTGSGTATAISDGGGAAGLAFDGNKETTWGSGGGAAPWWLTWDFGVGVAHDIQHLTLSNPTSADATSAPKNAKLQGSDDNASWVDVIIVTNNGAGYGASYVYLPPAAGQFTYSAPMGVVGIYSGASAGLVAPKAEIRATTGWSISVVCPRPTLSSSGNNFASISAPPPTLYATAHDSAGELSATLTAPSPTLSAYAGASSRLTAPAQSLASSGTVTGWATSALSAPGPALITTGAVSGMATVALKGPSPNLVGYSGAVCSITLTGSPTLQASATTGGIGGAALSCPLFELTSSATAQNHGGADLLAPSPRMGQTAQAWLAAPGARLTAIGSAVITATYEAYAVNLKHTPRGNEQPIDETTRYTNFPFTHVIRHKGCYYGANSTGLYLLEGTTDDTAPITWSVKTAMTDFKSPQRKTVASAYFGGRLGPADTITLHAGEGAQTQPYSYTTPRGALAQNYRQAFGKGIKQHRYYALAASGSGEMALDNIDLDVHNMTRRI